MYVCKRCHAELTTNGNLKKHLERKKTCFALFDNIDISVYMNELIKERPRDTHNHNCDHCQKGFKSLKTKCRHEITCKKNPNIQQISIVVDGNMDELKAEILKLRDKVYQQGKELQLYKDAPINNTNNITQNNQNITNNINIVLRNFGDENLDCLSDDICIGSYMFNDVITLIREMNFHPDFPENHNLDFTEDIIRKYLNGKWINSSWIKGVTDLIMAKIKFIEKLPDIIKEKKLDVQEYLIRNDWTQENFEEAPIERKDMIEDVKAKGRAFTQVEDYLLANVGREKQIELTIKEKADDEAKQNLIARAAIKKSCP